MPIASRFTYLHYACETCQALAMRNNAYICCIAFLAFAGRGAEFDLGEHGTLSVTVPESWSVTSKAANRSDGTPIGYAFAFKPRSDAMAKCLLTFAYVTNRVPDKQTIQKDVLRACEPFVEQSVEKKKNLREFALAKGYGAYCIFTDASLVGKKPEPGDYKVMGSGIVQPGNEVLGVVSLFAENAESEEFKTMIKIIDSLRLKAKEAR